MQYQPRNPAVLTLAALLLGACDIQDILGDADDARTLVNVSVTHHASATNGAFPDRGGDGEMRTFDTDEGWTIALVAAYVTTASVTLEPCAGADAVPLDMYWGPLAEDITARDLDMLSVGGVEVDGAEFCALQVHYGPYPETSRMAGLDPAMAGATLYLRGAATKGDRVVPFEIRSTESFDATVDMSKIDAGSPLRIEGGEDFPVELALSKTYDRLFDGIDFETATTADLSEQVGAVFALESRVSLDRVTP